MAKKKSKKEKLSELLNETRPTVHLNIEDIEGFDKAMKKAVEDGTLEEYMTYPMKPEDSFEVEHPVSGSIFESLRIGDRFWTNAESNASIESLGTRLNGLTAYKTVVNGVERVVDLKNMDEAIEFVNLLLDMGENGGK